MPATKDLSALVRVATNH